MAHEEDETILDSEKLKAAAKEEDAGVEEQELTPRDLPAAAPIPLDERDIRLDDIYELPNIRPDYHALDHLADSLHVQGQQQPCLVRPAPADAMHDKPFELVFGNRRKRAAEILGWETIRCEVREVPNERRRQVAIIENFHKEPLSPVAEARAIYDLKFSSDPALTNREVANQLGIDPSQVSHRLSMLIKLAPPQPMPELPTNYAESEDEDDEATPLTPSAHKPQRNERGELVLPGDQQPASEPADGEDDAEDGAKPEKPALDILALVNEGRISGSVAEVIASLDDREQQEKLTQLCLKQDWGVKKAAEWARGAKKYEVESVTDEEEGLGPVQMLQMVDVTPLQTLRVRADISEEQVNRVILYSQLRNGMDAEMLEYLYENMGFAYENLWDYVRLLDAEQVRELQRRLALRFISSAHRFFDLEPSLKDELGVPEDPEDGIEIPEADNSLALPGFQPQTDAFGALPEAGDELPEVPDDDA